MNSAVQPNVELHLAARQPLGGLVVRYAFGVCSLGTLLVARHGDGLCAIFLGDQPDLLHAQLADAMHGASLTEDAVGLKVEIARVTKYIDSPMPPETLALQLAGTPFQHRVWQAVCDIPAGETRTYGELARAVGAPAAVRAVGRALAANMFSVAIPCHRVIRRDGMPSGYRWGEARKRQILRREVR